jgi:hypothetical protein
MCCLSESESREHHVLQHKVADANVLPKRNPNRANITCFNITWRTPMCCLSEIRIARHITCGNG